ELPGITRGPGRAGHRSYSWYARVLAGHDGRTDVPYSWEEIKEGPTKTMKNRVIFAAAATLLTAVTAYSLDYWFEPAAFLPAAGCNVRVRLYEGGSDG